LLDVLAAIPDCAQAGLSAPDPVMVLCIDVHCYLWSFAAHVVIFAREIPGDRKFIVVYNEPPCFCRRISARGIKEQ
jgi:hypothetical protein